MAKKDEKGKKPIKKLLFNNEFMADEIADAIVDEMFKDSTNPEKNHSKRVE